MRVSRNFTYISLARQYLFFSVYDFIFTSFLHHRALIEGYITHGAVIFTHTTEQSNASPRYKASAVAGYVDVLSLYHF